MASKRWWARLRRRGGSVGPEVSSTPRPVAPEALPPAEPLVDELADEPVEPVLDQPVDAVDEVLDEPAGAVAVVDAPPVRSDPKPLVGDGRPIADRRPEDLAALAHWIESDGRTRSHGEMVDAMIDELGHVRRSPQIVAAVEAAVDRSRPRRPEVPPARSR